MEKYQFTTIEQQEIKPLPNVITALGPDLELENCKLTIRIGARNVCLVGVTLRNCDITANRKFRNVAWSRTIIKGCRFHGAFLGHDFGPRPDDKRTGIEDCDFRNAVLEGCRFIGCDINSIQLPSWPCFSLLNPMEDMGVMLSLEWPGKLGTWIRALNYSPATTVCIAEYAPRLMEQFGVSEQELKVAISRFPNIKF